jgi:hypothetical protein
VQADRLAAVTAALASLPKLDVAQLTIQQQHLAGSASFSSQQVLSSGLHIAY